VVTCRCGDLRWGGCDVSRGWLTRSAPRSRRQGHCPGRCGARFNIAPIAHELTPLPPCKAAKEQRKPLIAAAAIILVGYIAGRAVFERADGMLGSNGLGPGVASVAPAPLYLGVVITAVWVATRRSSLLGSIWLTLRISPQTLRYIGVGVLGSAFLVASVYGVDFVRGWITVKGGEPSTRLIADLSVYALLYFVIAFNEELVFRGGLLESLNRFGGNLCGVVGSSILFAMVHLADNSPWQRLFGLFLLGLLLAELYLIVRSLWLRSQFTGRCPFSVLRPLSACSRFRSI
jgi:membrane protease YdiL (CAAX protease family)